MKRPLLFNFAGIIAAVIAVTFFTAPSALAADLKPAQVESFVGSMEDVRAFAIALAEEGKDDIFDGEDAHEDFSPYLNGVKTLKEQSSADYKRFGAITKQHGFASQESWAETGDRVMLSYIAIKAEEANPDYAEMPTDIDPEMLAQLPPDAQAHIATTMKMMAKVQKTSETDKNAVKPFLPQIESWMEEEE